MASILSRQIYINLGSIFSQLNLIIILSIVDFSTENKSTVNVIELPLLNKI